jgi:basic amino acid/polyamine antiporter, APA family
MWPLFAFVLVSFGVILLRRSQPERARAFKVPLVPLFPILSILLCGGLMTGLTVVTWIRFFVWLALGLLIYVGYSHPAASSQKSNGSTSAQQLQFALTSE